MSCDFPVQPSELKLDFSNPHSARPFLLPTPTQQLKYPHFARDLPCLLPSTCFSSLDMSCAPVRSVDQNQYFPQKNYTRKGMIPTQLMPLLLSGILSYNGYFHLITDKYRYLNL
jgi:hypothetical protein